MPFIERLQSAMILKTSMLQPHEAEIIEHRHASFFDAIKTANLERIEALYYEGIDIDYHNFSDLTPLQHAIVNNQYKAITLLLDLGADVNVQNRRGNTALHVSIALKQYETIFLLLRYYANPYLKNHENRDSYESTSDEKIIEILDNTSAITLKHFDVFNHVMDNNLLGLVVRKRNDRVLFKVNKNKKTLLHLAYKRKKLLAYLLNKGLDIDAVDKHQQSALTLSSMNDDTHESLCYLLERGATIDHKTGSNASALLLAIKYGAVNNAKKLLEMGADIHLFLHTHTALTLTHHAINTYDAKRKEFRELETALLIKGASVDVSTNKLFWTPLIQTAIKPYDISTKTHMKLLIELGADVNYRDKNGRTALMLCASMGRFESCYKLINNYANLDILDNFGWSALMLAIYYNHESILTLLLESGTDVNLTNEKGHSALQIAKEHKREHLVSLLLDFGAISTDT